MKLIPFFSAVISLMLACQSNPNAQQVNVIPSDVHKVVVEEVLQTTNYTYLRVKENENEQWIALPKLAASAGETYYYKESMLMTNFTSKELNRTFDQILFIDNISKTADFTKNEVAPISPQDLKPHSSIPMSESGTEVNSNTTTEKQEVKIEPAKDGITIAALFKDVQSHSGKTVRIKGKVVKFNPGIMNKNWIHIQDGTEHSGKYDLTITTDAEVRPGDTVTLEGIIVLNKDFGYGYSYEVLMENAKLVN